SHQFLRDHDITAAHLAAFRRGDIHVDDAGRAIPFGDMVDALDDVAETQDAPLIDAFIDLFDLDVLITDEPQARRTPVAQVRVLRLRRVDRNGILVLPLHEYA